jgi:hypothetical protein
MFEKIEDYFLELIDVGCSFTLSFNVYDGKYKAIFDSFEKDVTYYFGYRINLTYSGFFKEFYGDRGQSHVNKSFDEFSKEVNLLNSLTKSVQQSKDRLTKIMKFKIVDDKASKSWDKDLVFSMVLIDPKERHELDYIISSYRKSKIGKVQGLLDKMEATFF